MIFYKCNESLFSFDFYGSIVLLSVVRLLYSKTNSQYQSLETNYFWYNNSLLFSMHWMKEFISRIINVDFILIMYSLIFNLVSILSKEWACVYVKYLHPRMLMDRKNRHIYSVWTMIRSFCCCFRSADISFVNGTNEKCCWFSEKNKTKKLCSAFFVELLLK